MAVAAETQSGCKLTSTPNLGIFNSSGNSQDQATCVKGEFCRRQTRFSLPQSKRIESTRKTHFTSRKPKMPMSNQYSSLFIFAVGCLLPIVVHSQASETNTQADRAQVVIGASANSPSVVAIPAETSWTGTIALSTHESKTMDQGNLRAWLDARRNENGLSSIKLQPWHILIMYDQFDEDGDNVHSGIVEEFWGGPQRWRLNFKSDEFSQTDFVTERGLYRAGDQRWQNRIQSEIRLAIIDPFSNAATLQGFRVTQTSRTFGNRELRCDMFERTSGGISSPNQYCYDSQDSALRYVRGPGWWQIAYNDVVSFQGSFVARNVEVTDGGHPFLKLRVAKLETLDRVDESELAPTADAVNLSGSRVSGVPVTPLKTVPIDTSAISGLPKFEVVVQIVIGKGGNVIEAKAISGPKEAYKAAESAARKWLFPPYLVAGQPTEVETKITFSKF